MRPRWPSIWAAARWCSTRRSTRRATWCITSATQSAYHDPAEQFEFKAAYIDELRALTPARLVRPDRYAAVIAKGDELLDWREMSQRYAGARIRLLEGGDHALSDFEQHLAFVLDFLKLSALPR